MMVNIGGDFIKLSIQSKKKEVISFLQQLQEVLQDENFDLNTNLTLIRKKKGKEKERFSTPYTLVDLNYDIYDVMEQLKCLTVREYAETLIDKDDVHPPLLFVFGKEINDKQIYVKLKIKENQVRRVLCVSFHYAENELFFPYI